MLIYSCYSPIIKFSIISIINKVNIHIKTSSIINHYRVPMTAENHFRLIPLQVSCTNNAYIEFYYYLIIAQHYQYHTLAIKYNSKITFANIDFV